MILVFLKYNHTNLCWREMNAHMHNQRPRLEKANMTSLLFTSNSSIMSGCCYQKIGCTSKNLFSLNTETNEMEFITKMIYKLFALFISYPSELINIS
jgi:hypothetical protein